MDRFTQHRSITAAFSVALVSGLASAASFSGIGDLPGGAFSSAAIGVSSDGQKVAGVSSPTNNTYTPFRWINGVFTPVAALPGSAMMLCLGMSADGGTIVGDGSTATPGYWQAYRWDPVTGTHSLGVMAGHTSTTARAASTNGAVIVGHGRDDSTDDYHAFRWTLPTGMVAIGNIPGYSGSVAYGVSNDGVVTVGYAQKAGVTQAMKHTTAGGMVGLGFLPGNTTYSIANDTNSNGSVIVGVAQRTIDEAFRWTPGVGMVGLGLMGPDGETNAKGVSDDGAVVVGNRFSLTDGYEAIVWDHAHGWRTVKQVLASKGIDASAWTLSNAYGVSGDGSVIVGDGGTAGHPEGWVAVIGPPCAGDTNGDDSVSFVDLNMVLSQFGQSGPLPAPTPGYRAGDVNNDGWVDFADLNIVLSAFGHTCQ